MKPKLAPRHAPRAGGRGLTPPVWASAIPTGMIIVADVVLLVASLRTIAKAMEINDAPVVVDFRVNKDAMVWPMIAGGASNDEIQYARDLAPKFDEDDL